MPMKSKRRHVMALFFCLVFLSSPPPAKSTEPWWNKTEEGWFFYHEKLEPELEQKQQTIPLYPEVSPPLFTETMKKKGEELLSKAMEKPTIGNVKAYMEHNRIMMALSKNFSLTWQKVLMSNPELLSGAMTSDADKDIFFKQTAESRRETLHKLAGKAGILFIYDTTCPYCVRQSKYLKAFLAEHPYFTIKAVTINGQILPEFPESSPDNGIAERLGVFSHPVIFLMYPPDRFERISTGLVTADELRDKLLWHTAETSVGLNEPASEEKGRGKEEWEPPSHIPPLAFEFGGDR